MVSDRLFFVLKQVKQATQQKYIHRMKRDGIPTDPKFGEMWYLVRTVLRNAIVSS
jgi:hypothetical protein